MRLQRLLKRTRRRRLLMVKFFAANAGVGTQGENFKSPHQQDLKNLGNVYNIFSFSRNTFSLKRHVFFSSDNPRRARIPCRVPRHQRDGLNQGRRGKTRQPILMRFCDASQVRSDKFKLDGRVLYNVTSLTRSDQAVALVRGMLRDNYPD